MPHQGQQGPPPAVRYGVALFCVVVVWAIHAVLDPHIRGEQQSFLLFLIPVLLMGWWAGAGPAAFAAVIGWFAVDWFFIVPRNSVSLGGLRELTHSIGYLAISAGLIAVTHHLRQARFQVETILHSITGAFLAIDRKGRLTYANPAAEQLLQKPAAQLRGRKLHEVIPQADSFLERFAEARATGRTVRFEDSFVPGQVLLEVQIYPTSLGFSIYCRDITEHRRAQDALQESEERFRLFMDHSPSLAWVKDEQGRYIYVNRAYEKRFGVSLAACQGKTDADLWPAEVADRLQRVDRAALAAPGPVEVTEDTTEPNGSHSFWLNTKFAFRDGSGQRFIASLGLDITPRKLHEEALREHAHLEQLRADAIETLQQPARRPFPIQNRLKAELQTSDRLKAELRTLSRLKAELRTGELPLGTRDLLQRVAALLVERLDAAFARVWTLNAAGDTLELQASAGLYTHLDGRHGRVAVGRLKIGRIAEQRQPLVTNQVVGDPHIPEQDWARREGLVAFAGFPLVSDERLLGVLALFARHTLSPAAVHTLSSLAGILAQALARKQAEEELVREKEFSDYTINSLPGVFYLFDAQDRPRRWNRNLQTLSGYSREEISRMQVLDFISPEDRPAARAAIDKVRATGESSAELLCITKTGRRILFSFTSLRVNVDGGPGFLGVGVDITQRKQFERALRENEARLRLAVETAGLALYERDLVANRIRMNKTCKAILGLKEGPFGPDVARRSVHPEDQQRVFAEVARAFDPELREVCAAEFRILRPDGSVRWVAGRGRVIFEDRGTPPQPLRFLGVLNDITHRKEAEEQLVRRNLHLKLLHEAAAGLVLSRQPVETMASLHPQLAQRFGVDVLLLYEAEPNAGSLRLRVSLGVSEAERRKLEPLRFGRAICARPADGLQPLVASHIQTAEAPDRRLVRRLGFRWYLFYPLMLNNRLQGTLALASRRRDHYDQTDLEFFHTIADTLAQALERRRLETELHRHAAHLDSLVRERTANLQNTIAELEGFSYSLVHDLRAPLRAMNAYASILESDAAARLREGELGLLNRIKVAGVRMDHLVTDALNYSRILRDNLPLRPVNLGALLRGMIETYPNLQPPHARVDLEIGDLWVTGNESALTQVFSNLLDNAVKFVSPGIQPRVRVWAGSGVEGGGGPPEGGTTNVAGPPEGGTTNVAGPPEGGTTNAGEAGSGWVRICVRDNGIGISKEFQQQIFGMFQRLHGEDIYPGTGIGLAMVRKSLERMGGHIGVVSEPGRGSTFCVELRTPMPEASLAE